MLYKPIVLHRHMHDIRKGTKPKRDDCSRLFCLCTLVNVMQSTTFTVSVLCFAHSRSLPKPQQISHKKTNSSNNRTLKWWSVMNNVSSGIFRRMVERSCVSLQCVVAPVFEPTAQSQREGSMDNEGIITIALCAQI